MKGTQVGSLFPDKWVIGGIRWWSTKVKIMGKQQVYRMLYIVEDVARAMARVIKDIVFSIYRRMLGIETL
jgi:hypothetical protein